MNLKERFLAAIQRETVDRVPCACPLQTGTVDLMNECGAKWPEAFRDPKKMAILSAAAYKLAGIESVRVPFDLSVEAEALGSKVSTKGEAAQPRIMTPAVKSQEDLENLKVPDPKGSESMMAVLKAITILREKVGNNVPIVAGALAPLTLAGQIRGIENFFKDLKFNPDFVRTLLHMTEEVAAAYTLALVEAGADVICLVDPTATGEMLGPERHKDFASPYTKRVVEKIHGAGAPVVLHICGNSKPVWDYMIETGADMLSLSEQVDMAEAKHRMGDKVALAGNINPVKTLLFGTIHDVERSVKECIEKGVDDVCPGCGFEPRTPLENMKKMVDACKSQGHTR